MSGMIVRKIEPRDYDQVRRVRSVTYNSGEPIDEAGLERMLKVPFFVAEKDGDVAGQYIALEMTCTRGDAVLSCGGIAAVAVAPEARGNNFGLEMMRQSVRIMREDGHRIASLYPFREAFYRKAGYETAGLRYGITVPVGRYPKIQSELPVTYHSAHDRDLMKPVYQAFATARSGLNLRDDWWWDRIAEKDCNKAIYIAGDPAEAYAVVSHKVDFFVTQEVQEFVWSTKRGYDAILGVLTSIGANKTELKWNEPSDSPYLAHYLDQGVKVQAERLIQYRVLHVLEALRSLRCTEDAEFTLAVHDAEIPENNGPWRVWSSEGQVEVEPWSGDADLEMDIRQFTQAFLGEPSLANLARNGLVGVRNRAGLVSAQRLLTPMPVACYDFF